MLYRVISEIIPKKKKKHPVVMLPRFFSCVPKLPSLALGCVFTFKSLPCIMNSACYTAFSLMQEPFLSIPLIWLIHEDTLGKRLREYEEKGFDGLISQWRSSFYRANAIIFPDFSLPVKHPCLSL